MAEMARVCIGLEQPRTKLCRELFVGVMPRGVGATVGTGELWCAPFILVEALDIFTKHELALNFTGCAPKSIRRNPTKSNTIPLAIRQASVACMLTGCK